MPSAAKGATWLGRYPITLAEHVPDLEQRAAVHEFHNKMPRHQAEEAAYGDYKRDQLVEATAHHLVGMRAAHAAGQIDQAKRHGVMYTLGLKALGHDNAVSPPEEVASKAAHTPSEVYRFKAHPGDAFALQALDQPPPALAKKEIEVPDDHKVGMTVPEGGSSCAKCAFVSGDLKKCGQKDFQEWNGGPELPAPAERYCCDFFQISTKKAEAPIEVTSPKDVVEKRRYGQNGRTAAGKKNPFFNYDDYVPEKLKGQPNRPSGITVHQRGKEVIAQLNHGFGDVRAFRRGDGGYSLSYDGLKHAHPVVAQYRQHVLRALGDHLKSAHGAPYFLVGSEGPAN